LIGSRENILKIIKKVDHDSRIKFMETFDQIRANFQYIFTKLFGEGEADIYLLDEENVLDCGIDIYVKPKGKQPKVINLLSGGEKALTAASLVLAIFMIKPSPFCLLDEVDAALDDANIERFFSLLREFSDKTQFIIITHNKRTMEFSDAIYGVTMEEIGVSKIISAKFSEDGKLITAQSGE
ncbi:MAG: AAA family ATPase, partial [bacterium]|nr:AAA family ATPase [bacterium]